MSSSSSRRVVRRSSEANLSASLTNLEETSDALATPNKRKGQSVKPSSAPHSSVPDESGVSRSQGDHRRLPASRAPQPSHASSSASSGVQEMRVSSAGSIVSRVRIDVATHRHSQQRATPGGARVSRESALTSSAVTASSAMTHQSICRMERELGRSLPLNGTGSHVMLSSSDLLQVRDTETLKFLEANSELFVKYFRETHRTQQSQEDASSRQHIEPSKSDAAGAQRRSAEGGHSAEDIANQVKVLCEEIETFITAVDIEGKEFQVQVGEDGLLPIPVDASLLDEDGDTVVLADMDDFTSDELQAFNREFGLEAEEDGAAEEIEEEEEEMDGSSTDASNQGCGEAEESSEGSAPSRNDQSMTAEDAIRKRFDDHRKLLALTGELQLQRKLNAVVAHHKGDKPRYMSSTAASTVAGTKSSIPPSPPPAPHPSKFKVQYCNSRPSGGAPGRIVDMPPVIPVREQRQTLSADEEERIRFLLEHDDWEQLSMDQLEAVAASTDADDAASAVTRHTTHTALSYDSSSTKSYAAGNGGYTVDAQSQQRLRDIDAQLDMLRGVRESEEGEMTNTLDGGESCAPPSLMCTASPVTSRTPNASIPRTAQTSSTRTSRTKGHVVPAPAPVTAAAEAEKAAAARRKAMGDGYLKNYREDKHIRQELRALNGRLSEISSEMDTLMTPPFSFHMTYEMNSDPSEWEWPVDLAKPSEDMIQKLLSVAVKEQRSAQRKRFMTSLPGTPPSENVASRVLVNNFVPLEVQDAAREAEEAQQRSDFVSDETAHAPPTSGYFHEQLRARLQRTQDLMREVNSLVDRGVESVHNFAVPVDDGDEVGLE